MKTMQAIFRGKDSRALSGVQDSFWKSIANIDVHNTDPLYQNQIRDSLQEVVNVLKDSTAKDTFIQNIQELNTRFVGLGIAQLHS